MHRAGVITPGRSRPMMSTGWSLVHGPCLLGCEHPALPTANCDFAPIHILSNSNWLRKGACIHHVFQGPGGNVQSLAQADLVEQMGKRGIGMSWQGCSVRCALHVARLGHVVLQHESEMSIGGPVQHACQFLQERGEKQMRATDAGHALLLDEVHDILKSVVEF